MGEIQYYTQPSGKRVRSCSCMVESLPWITAYLIHKGVLKQELDFTQGAYNTSVSASALTHAGGGVGDILPIGNYGDELLEECGIASYQRDYRDGMSAHHHILWIGCPHQHASAARQVTAWKNLRNGLVSNAPDRDQTRPNPIRTWQQGVAWIKEQLEEELTMSQYEDIMKELAVIRDNTATAFGPLGGRAYISEHNMTTGNYVVKYPIWRGGKGIPLVQEIADIKTTVLRMEAQSAALFLLLSNLTQSKDIDMEELKETIDSTIVAALDRFSLSAEIKFTEDDTV